jgi:hypothetical protein
VTQKASHNVRMFLEREIEGRGVCRQLAGVVSTARSGAGPRPDHSDYTDLVGRTVLCYFTVFVIKKALKLRMFSWLSV